MGDYPETTRKERPETTRREYPETTRMERPETTRKERPETTRMDYPETTRPERPESTRPERPETTADVPEPTQSWERFGKLDAENMKCGMGAARAFKIGFSSLELCIRRCQADSRCNFATTEMKQHCIGCKDKPNVKGDGWYSYEV